jgi:NAD(P)H-dependent flavin oxidoreductase YrpB (nitropropane dioxygenase family)
MTPEVPILQGGMGVGISLSKLASAVANAGGIGIISGTGITVDEMRTHIRKAKNSIKQGYIGVNVLFAMNDFAEKMKAALEFQEICTHGANKLGFQFYLLFLLLN